MTTQTRPAAYLRKSTDAVTKQDHLERLIGSVRENGHSGDTIVYDDWARSGDIRKLAKRTGWRALCEAIERGEHDVVFMNDLDRGGRSIEEWARFMRGSRPGCPGHRRRDRLVGLGTGSWSSTSEPCSLKRSSSAPRLGLRRQLGCESAAGTRRRPASLPTAIGWPRPGMSGSPTRIVRTPSGWSSFPDPDEPLEPVLQGGHGRCGQAADPPQGPAPHPGREGCRGQGEGSQAGAGETPRAACLCGCGGIPKGKKARYLPGHDARHHAALKVAGKRVTFVTPAESRERTRDAGRAVRAGERTVSDSR